MGWIASAQLPVEGLQESATIRSGEGWNIQSVHITEILRSKVKERGFVGFMWGIPGIDRSEELME